MSFFSKIGSIAKKVVGYVAPLTGLIPGVGGTIAGALAGAVGTGKPQSAPPVTTAGTTGGGLLQTIPSLGGPQSGGGIGGYPSPQGLMTQLGAAASQFARGGVAALTGTTVAGSRAGATRMKIGRLTGNMIPAGYVEKMSPTGVIYLGKQRRRRGISARDIGAFYRVNRLVAKVHGRAHRAPRRGK